MGEQDILQRMREYIERDVFQSEKNTPSSDLLIMYTLIRIHDKLEAIDASLGTLVSNSNDAWNERHNQ